MAETGAARSVAAARREAEHCRDCGLWRAATQTVFGDGATASRLMLVGEQPGDREDRAGRPFVGPAGALLDRALASACIDRSDAYVTNVVKHFKHRARGKRRIHQRPDAGEIAACRKWLDAELRLVQPQILICLGLTAAHALLGRGLSIAHDRGRLIECELAPKAMLTAHPSAILRERDHNARGAAMAALVKDLELAASAAVSAA